VAIVAADLIGLDGPSVQRIRAAVGAAGVVPSEHVMVTCSHTHSGPAVQGLGPAAVDEAYQQWVEQALAGVVVAAAGSLQPAHVGIAEGTMDFNVNRRRRTPTGTLMRANLLGVVDRRVRVLRFDPADAPAARGTLGGQLLPQSDPIALLFAYACHPTSLGGRDFHPYSGDYPGATRRVVEGVYRSYGADETPCVLFLPVCFGDVRPHLLAPTGTFRSATSHELEVLGRMLGTEVVQVAETIVAEPVYDLALARGEVRLPYARVADDAAIRAALDSRDAAERYWGEVMRHRLETDGALPEAETAEVAVLRLGRHWLVFTPGETFLEIGWSIERGLVELGLASRERGDLTLALGYSNGNVGYLCTASSIPDGGYEPAGSYFWYLRPGPFAPEVESVLITAALTLAREIGPSPSGAA
jgi:hypothetical protein